MKKLPDDPEDLIAAMKESNTIDYFEEMIIFFFENDLQVISHVNNVLFVLHCQTPKLKFLGPEIYPSKNFYQNLFQFCTPGIILVPEIIRKIYEVFIRHFMLIKAVNTPNIFRETSEFCSTMFHIMFIRQYFFVYIYIKY